MSDHAVHGTASGAVPVTHGQTARRTGWVGWLYFGGTMLILVGTFNLIEGLVALFNDQYYVPTRQGLLVFDITTWGWIHLIMGALAVIVGFGVFVGATWARIAGVAFASFNAIAQLAFLSAYPLWATIVITIDILIIWALIVHGDETRSTEDW
ncbi:MAG: hypothetical protein WBA97_07855 [Actinophytocola sp.]|uniref:DUF7144 family membrane protein n=1 Tax=Actinophytocola sp. TaxID=1872138 RepID=UPI003C73DAC3